MRQRYSTVGSAKVPTPDDIFKKNAAYKVVDGQSDEALLKASQTDPLIKFTKEVHDTLLSKHPDTKNADFNSTLGYIKMLSIPDDVINKP